MLIAGTMGSYLKSISFKQEWQKKKSDLNIASGPKVVSTDSTEKKGQVYNSALDSFMKEQEEMRRKINSLLRESAECSRASAEFKLQYGGKLSAREMEYIRNNCPDLYAKAMEREKERQAYAAKLRECKSKDEVFALRMGKLNSLMGEVKSAESRGDYGASFELRARLYNIEEEHDEFIKSDEYQELCRKEKAEKETAEQQQLAQKDQENEDETKEQDVSREKSAEGEIFEDNFTSIEEGTLPTVNQGGFQENVEKDDGKKHRHTDKRHGIPVAEEKIKSASAKYQKNHSDMAKETFNTSLDIPSNDDLKLPLSSIGEIKGHLSIKA